MMDRYPKNSLNDLIENGNDEYDSFYDLPYEAQQVLRNHSRDYHPYGGLRINPRFLLEDFQNSFSQ